MKFNLFILLFLASTTTFAGFSSRINSIIEEGNTRTYNFSIGGMGETSEMQSPCFGQTYCTLEINHRHTASGVGGDEGGVLPQCKVSAAQGTTTAKTLAELYKLYQANCPTPLTGTMVHRGAADFPECIGVFYRTSPNGPAIEFPGTMCVLTAEQNNVCNFDTGMAFVDFQIVTPAIIKAGTRTASNYFFLHCNYPTTVNVFVSGTELSDERGFGKLGNTDIRSQTTVLLSDFDATPQARAMTTIKAKPGVFYLFTIYHRLYANTVGVYGEPDVPKGRFGAGRVVTLSIP